MEKALVYIDAGFLSKVSKNLGGGIPIKFDLLKFCKNLTGKQNLIFKQLYYYNAPPFQPSNPTREEKARKERYDLFIQSLKRESGVTVREGRCQRLKIDGKYVYKQKGVDTLMTMDLMYVPLEHEKIKDIIIIASDSDFVPIIKRLRELGIKITLFTYFDRQRDSKFSTSNNLLKAVNKYIQLSVNDFLDSKR
mgnify:CR=1 FL=1